MTQAQTQYLPLKINTAGVIPVIFSGAILQFFPMVFGILPGGGAQGGFMGKISGLFAMQSPYKPLRHVNTCRWAGWHRFSNRSIFMSSFTSY